MVTRQDWMALSSGGVIQEAGSSVHYETGSWRTLRPVIDLSSCTHCMICWIFCPDSSFLVEEKRLVSVDIDHCKGCGICAEECPKQCIKMVEETALRGGI